MSKKLNTSLRCVAALAMVSAGTAHAQMSPSYSYFGLGVGQSQSQLDEQTTTNSAVGAAGPGSSLTTSNRKDTAYKVFGGYQLNRFMAVEGGYFNLGKFNYRATAGANTLDSNYDVEGLNVDFVATLPITDRFSAFGRLGAQYANTRNTSVGTGTLAVAPSSRNKYDTNPKIGLGLQYEISPMMLIRGEAERYRINDAFDNRGDVNVYSLSLVFPIGRTAQRQQVAAAPYVEPAPAPTPAPAPVAPTPVPAPVVAAPTPAPVTLAPELRRVQLSADSMFGFNKSELAPQAQGALDTFARSTRGVKFDTITVQGNTDRLGSTAYNQKLSEQRAMAVKAYLASTAELSGATINASGNGETNPVTQPSDCVGTKRTAQLVACLAPDRRVDVEITGVQ